MRCGSGSDGPETDEIMDRPIDFDISGKNRSLTVENQVVSIQFNKCSRIKHCPNPGQICLDERQQVVVCDVSGRDEKQTFRFSMEKKRVHEILVLSHHNAGFEVSDADYRRIGGSIPIREVESVNGVFSMFTEQRRKTPWELSIDEPVHPFTASSRRVRASRVAHAIAACKSSCSRSEKSARISSWLIPELSHSRTFSTGYRRPRMHGLPWQISGETVIRERSSASFMIQRLTERMKTVNTGLRALLPQLI